MEYIMAASDAHTQSLEGAKAREDVEVILVGREVAAAARRGHFHARVGEYLSKGTVRRLEALGYCVQVQADPAGHYFSMVEW